MDIYENNGVVQMDSNFNIEERDGQFIVLRNQN